MTDFLFDVIATELEDAVGKENCSTRTIDKVSHSVDYFWLSRMWADRGLRMPEGDFIVTPKDAKEVSAVLKIANYYKIPVTTWGAGGGSPSAADRILSTRYGVAAVELAIAGKFGNMVALKDNKMKYASLEDVIGCNKAVDSEGELVQVAKAIGICFGD